MASDGSYRGIWTPEDGRNASPAYSEEEKVKMNRRSVKVVMTRYGRMIFLFIINLTVVRRKHMFALWYGRGNSKIFVSWTVASWWYGSTPAEGGKMRPITV